MKYFQKQIILLSLIVRINVIITMAFNLYIMMVKDKRIKIIDYAYMLLQWLQNNETLYITFDNTKILFKFISF